MNIEEYATKLIKYGEEEQTLMHKALDNSLDLNDEKLLQEIYSRDEKFIEEIMDKYGWPKRSEFGKQACIFAFLFVQHSRDIRLQKKALEMMKKLDEAEVSKKNISYLEDRIRMRESFETTYGNVFYTDGPDYNVLPLFVSENKVNKLREPIGLDTIREQALEAMKVFKKKDTLVLEVVKGF